MRLGLPAIARAGLLCALTACQGWPIRPAPAEWQDYQRHWRPVSAWQIEGRFALRVGSENGQGLLQWQQQGDNFRVLLTSPLAQGGVLLDVATNGAQLRTAQGETFTGEDPEELLVRHTGWHLPVRAMADWLRALPAPGAFYRAEWDEHGQLHRLSQWGWDIQYTRYDPESALPAKLLLHQADVEAKLVIDRWDTTPPLGLRPR